jgi:hypothetical protein
VQEAPVLQRKLCAATLECERISSREQQVYITAQQTPEEQHVFHLSQMVGASNLHLKIVKSSSKRCNMI